MPQGCTASGQQAVLQAAGNQRSLVWANEGQLKGSTLVEVPLQGRAHAGAAQGRKCPG